ncbi:hypothetical protein HDU67_009515 [Dinochytrium kinnereticum]|nr:hypothetical protein HDU67_009515 [Dinochytrium kinnereticum]
MSRKQQGFVRLPEDVAEKRPSIKSMGSKATPSALQLFQPKGASYRRSMSMTTSATSMNAILISTKDNLPAQTFDHHEEEVDLGHDLGSQPVISFPGDGHFVGSVEDLNGLNRGPNGSGVGDRLDNHQPIARLNSGVQHSTGAGIHKSTLGARNSTVGTYNSTLGGRPSAPFRSMSSPVPKSRGSASVLWHQDSRFTQNGGSIPEPTDSGFQSGSTTPTVVKRSASPLDVVERIETSVRPLACLIRGARSDVEKTVDQCSRVDVLREVERERTIHEQPFLVNGKRMASPSLRSLIVTDCPPKATLDPSTAPRHPSSQKWPRPFRRHSIAVTPTPPPAPTPNQRKSSGLSRVFSLFTLSPKKKSSNSHLLPLVPPNLESTDNPVVAGEVEISPRLRHKPLGPRPSPVLSTRKERRPRVCAAVAALAEMDVAEGRQGSRTHSGAGFDLGMGPENVVMFSASGELPCWEKGV